jgi:uncharacterized protein (TIGR03435 family)
MTRALVPILLAVLAIAQPATFETASIHPVADMSTCKGSIINPLPGAGLKIDCVPLRAIVTWAYRIQDYQLSGGPSWLTSVGWNIMAKSEQHGAPETTKYEDLTEAQRIARQNDVRTHLQALLADRFQLQLHRELKPQTVYSLTVAKTGSRMNPVERAGMIRRGKAQIKSTGTTMALLSSYLGIALGRPVTDKTGLTAYYAFELNWTPDGAESTDAATPSLVTAIQEQLGLRLESTKAPVESFFIERVQKASEN